VPALTSDAKITMYGCSAGAATEPMKNFANASGATVYALKIDNGIVRPPPGMTLSPAMRARYMFPVTPGAPNVQTFTPAGH
jgi:hypothetical protein